MCSQDSWVSHVDASTLGSASPRRCGLRSCSVSSFGVGRASCNLSHKDSRQSGGTDDDRSIRVCLMNELMSSPTGQDGGS